MSSLLLCSTPVHGHVTPLLAVARAPRRGRPPGAVPHRPPLPRRRRSDGSRVVRPPRRGRLRRQRRERRRSRAASAAAVLDGIRWDMREIFLKPAPAPARRGRRGHRRTSRSTRSSSRRCSSAPCCSSCAEASARPLITLGIVPLGVRSRDTAPFGLGVRPMPGPVGRLRNRVLGFVAGQHHLRPGAEGCRGHRQAGHRRRPHRCRSSRLVGARRRARAVHGAVVRVPAQRPAPARALRRSGLAHDRIEHAAARMVGRPRRSGTPVVHVTQGTVANADFAELIDPDHRGARRTRTCSSSSAPGVATSRCATTRPTCASRPTCRTTAAPAHRRLRHQRRVRRRALRDRARRADRGRPAARRTRSR